MKTFAIKPLVGACVIAMSGAAAPVLGADEDKDRPDLWSKATLATTYTLNRHLNPFDIDIEVENGVATLQGQVDSEVEKDLAEEIALGVEGIDEVKNQLQVVEGVSDRRTGQTRDKQESDFLRIVENANITAKVKSQLLWNDNTQGMSINVDTEDGVVTLSGSVASDAQAQLAEQIAKNTNDVRSVQNRLKVDGQQASVLDKAAGKMRQAGKTVSDGWITSKVNSALLFNRNVDGSNIDVDTDNGVVTLKGQVATETEMEQAVSIARGIKGVKEVKAELQAGSTARVQSSR